MPELSQELRYTPLAALQFTRFDIDFNPLGQSRAFRIYHEVPVRSVAFSPFA